MKLEASRRFHKFHTMMASVKLVNLGESMKFHTESLSVNKLSVGETCEDTFQPFIKLHQLINRKTTS